MNEIQNIFNSLHASLQFTIEIVTQGRLNFLDTTIIVEKNRIIFDRFQKSTCSGRFLNFHSHHPFCHKRGVIIGAVDRIILLSHPKFQEKNLVDAIHTFLENGYPLHFIFSTIQNRLFFHFRNSKNSHFLSSKKKITVDKFFTIPYIKSVSESFRPNALKMNSKLAYSIPNTLTGGEQITRGEDGIMASQFHFTQ
ncbi:hypothetical protein ALC60_11170 [Trachymyrmex zeteki]|uniref:Helix-turn-helix domain-containing protein n=1 Tax=Mycetomoellerius zeteki TaxID=64791 RepID=A0A151WPN7_9HYME|nr:hypothetical protein ALC60_11170 [Trachymyrmex zeteki]